MAQVVANPDGSFSSVVGDTDVTDMVYEDVQEVLEGQEESEAVDDVEASEDILDGVEPPSVEGAPEASASEDFGYGDYAVVPLSSIPSNAVFNPTAWQINLAESRQLGEHYLMYAVRRSSGSSYYWQYYLVLGRDISLANDVYTFSDCDVYSYYSYNSTVLYELSVDSGSVNGDVNLVYSDLYFDYVGTDPAWNSYPFISFAMFVLIFVLLLIGGRKRV